VWPQLFEWIENIVPHAIFGIKYHIRHVRCLIFKIINYNMEQAHHKNVEIFSYEYDWYFGSIIQAPNICHAKKNTFYMYANIII
jgi:hypothetical protein